MGLLFWQLEVFDSGCIVFATQLDSNKEDNILTFCFTELLELHSLDIIKQHNKMKRLTTRSESKLNYKWRMKVCRLDAIKREGPVDCV